MPKAKITEGTKILSIRFPEALIKRLDHYVKRFQKEFPGISFQRTDAIRLFVERGLKDPIVQYHQAPESRKPEKPKAKKEFGDQVLPKRKQGAVRPKTRKKNG